MLRRFRKDGMNDTLSQVSSIFPVISDFQMLAGGIAGVLCWWSICPLEVVKNRIQTDTTGLQTWAFSFSSLDFGTTESFYQSPSSSGRKEDTSLSIGEAWPLPSEGLSCARQFFSSMKTYCSPFRNKLSSACVRVCWTKRGNQANRLSSLFNWISWELKWSVCSSFVYFSLVSKINLSVVTHYWTFYWFFNRHELSLSLSAPGSLPLFAATVLDLFGTRCRSYQIVCIRAWAREWVIGQLSKAVYHLPSLNGKH